MTPQQMTGCFIGLTALVITAYDLFVWWKWGVNTTISDVTRKANEKWPLIAPWIAFAAGCLYGHLFLQ